MSEHQKDQKHVLEIIRLITDNAKKSKLSQEFFSKNEHELQEIVAYFDASPIQAVLVSTIFAYNFERGAAGVDDLSDFFDCNPLQLLEHKPDLDALVKRGLLKRVTNKRSRSAYSLSNIDFYVPDNICASILDNNPILKSQSQEIHDIFDLLETFYKYGWNPEGEALPTSELFEKSTELLEEYPDFSMIKNLKSCRLSPENVVMMLFLYWTYVNGNAEVDLETAVNAVFNTTKMRFECTKSLILEQHPLIESKLVEIQKHRFFNDSVIKLSNKSINWLLNDNLRLKIYKEKRDNVISPAGIKHKELLYSDIESEQISQIRQSLIDHNLRSIQDRMISKGLPAGLTVLFHGASGTGKTESVYQLARESGREIMLVDISKSKSAWFGESEKIIKKTFTDYYDYKNESEVCPILFFNEADGIFSRRKDVTSSNVAQTENAMQNIILQEMESFTGILFATTNLIANIDFAFERRFLFKLKFSKPDPSMRAKIWKLKLPKISDKDALLLGELFDMSGGQIDNIVRKFEIVEILEDRSPSLQEIIFYCEKENFEQQQVRKIGF